MTFIHGMFWCINPMCSVWVFGESASECPGCGHPGRPIEGNTLKAFNLITLDM